MKIWTKAKDDKMFYSTSLSRKTMEGKWENMYIPVTIPKNKVVSNGDNIFVKNGFWSWYKTNDGLPKVDIVIMDFDILGEQALENDVFEEIESEELDLPF
jgi:hypothetical protein